MTTTAQSIIKNAVTILQDESNVRWHADELVRWLNAGEQEMLVYRPDIFSTYSQLTLVAGTRQTLPPPAAKLIDIINNVGGKKLPVRQVSRRMLDDITPEWHASRNSAEIRHFTYDPRTPRTFYVDPPAIAGTQLNAEVATIPSPVTVPAPGASYTTITGNINAPDIFANALLDYVIYRAYSKDSEYADNAERAKTHYAAFMSTLGVESKVTSIAGPDVGAPGESEAA